MLTLSYRQEPPHVAAKPADSLPRPGGRRRALTETATATCFEVDALDAFGAETVLMASITNAAFAKEVGLQSCGSNSMNTEH